jgi:N-acetylglutamate synthase-like GNAT family acetyltransferase
MAWIFAQVQSDLEYPPAPGTGGIRFWLGLLFATEALGFGKLLHWAWCQAQDLSMSDFWDAKTDNKKVGSLWVTHHKAGFTSISVLCVQPKYRRRGVGADLVRSLLKSTKQPVFVRSLPALEALYARCGFVPVQARLLPFHLISPSYGYNWVYLPKRSIQQQ